MKSTDKYGFFTPQGEEYYDNEHQNHNWDTLEKILIEASVPNSGTIIQKLENGSLKILFPDGTYSIYDPMKETGEINVNTYNKDGALTDEQIAYAWESIAGTHLRIDYVINLISQKDDAIWTILGESGIAVQNTMTTYQFNRSPLDTADTVSADDTWLDKEIKVKVLWVDSSYTDYVLLPNGRTKVYQYDKGGNLESETELPTFTKNIIMTNVRIAQMEKKFELLTMELQKFNIPIPGSLFTVVDGVTNEAVSNCEFSPLHGTNEDAKVMGYYTFDSIMRGTYAVSARIVSTTNISSQILKFEVLDGDNTGRVIATCQIKGSDLDAVLDKDGNVVANAYSHTVGFGFKLDNSADEKRRMTVRVTSGSGGSTSGKITDIYLDYIILHRGQPAFGAAYAY